MKNITLVRDGKATTIGNIVFTSIALIAALLLVFEVDANSPYVSRILKTCCVYAVSGLALNLIHGITGQFSLGQAGFMALGAYTTAILILPAETKQTLYYGTGVNEWIGSINMPFIPAMITGGLIAAVAGLIIAFPIFRLKDDYLSIATMGFSEIIRIFITNQARITNGPLGLKMIPAYANMWVTLLLTLLVVVIMVSMIKSSYGRAFKAIRDDEVAAEAMGVSLFKHKLTSFVVSAFFAGVSGGLLASVVGTINPNYFKYTLSNEILLMVVLGGLGSTTGTIIGAFAITIAKEVLRFLDNDIIIGAFRIPGVSGMRMLFFSVLLMIIILFRPQGIFGQHEFSWNWLIGLFRKKKKPLEGTTVIEQEETK